MDQIVVSVIVLCLMIVALVIQLQITALNIKIDIIEELNLIKENKSRQKKKA